MRVPRFGSHRELILHHLLYHDKAQVFLHSNTNGIFCTASAKEQLHSGVEQIVCGSGGWGLTRGGKVLRMELTSACERAALQPAGCVTAASLSLQGMEAVFLPERTRAGPESSPCKLDAHSICQNFARTEEKQERQERGPMRQIEEIICITETSAKPDTRTPVR